MKPIELKDVMKEFLTQEEINEIETEIKEKRTRGGARENSGRKPAVKGSILKFTKRLTDKEVKFIEYARSRNINYDDLMQG